MQRRQEEYIKFSILIALEDGTSQRFGDLVVDSLSIYYIFALMFHYLYRRPLAFSEFFFYFIS